VQHNLEQIEFGPNPNVMPADNAIGEGNIKSNKN
jgi:hypothetical protein